MLDRIKDWWDLTAREIVENAAVVTTLVTVVYAFASLVHSGLSFVLKFTGLHIALKAWVAYSIGWSLTMLYLEFKQRKEEKTEEEQPPSFL